MSEFAYEFAHLDLFGVKLIRKTITMEYNNLEKFIKYVTFLHENLSIVIPVLRGLLTLGLPRC